MRFSQAFVVLAFVVIVQILSPSFGFVQEAKSPAPPEAEVSQPIGLADSSAVDPEFEKAVRSLDETMNYEPAKELGVKNRLVSVALAGGLLLGLLGIIFMYLRLDHATRGFYSGRLQTLAIVVAVVLLAATYFLWIQLHY
ncbi:MAG: hypothetical protein AB8B55_09085 [Mariniblastus sp.]